jgi:hypothetical protein
MLLLWLLLCFVSASTKNLLATFRQVEETDPTLLASFIDDPVYNRISTEDISRFFQDAFKAGDMDTILWYTSSMNISKVICFNPDGSLVWIATEYGHHELLAFWLEYGKRKLSASNFLRRIFLAVINDEAQFSRMRQLPMLAKLMASTFDLSDILQCFREIVFTKYQDDIKYQLKLLVTLVSLYAGEPTLAAKMLQLSELPVEVRVVILRHLLALI